MSDYKISYSFGGNAQQSREDSVTTTLTDTYCCEMDQVLRGILVCFNTDQSHEVWSERDWSGEHLKISPEPQRGQAGEQWECAEQLGSGCEALELR